MAVNVIQGSKEKPAPEIVHPLLASREAQIARGRSFLFEDSGDHLVSTVVTQAIPQLHLNREIEISGSGFQFRAVIKSFTLQGGRRGVSATVSTRRRVDNE